MARICYGVAGEGRGHATRVRTMVEALRRHHTVTIFAPHDAFTLLGAAYAGSDVEVVRIPGLKHGYSRSGHLSLLATAATALPFLLRLEGILSALERVVAARDPDLIITDFEPLLPRLARRLRVPFISIDHQRFLVDCDLSCLPPRLYRGARFLSLFVRAFYRGQQASVISSFFRLPLRPRRRAVLQVGVLLRPELERARVSEGEHLVAYLRRGATANVLRALAEVECEVRVYGADERPREGRLHFRPISEAGFIADLASAAALVTTAGNQVVGEAVALGKPVLALPETGNLEQEINGHFVQWCGAGVTVPYERLRGEHVAHFLARLPELRRGLGRLPGKGNEAALAAVERHLPGSHRLPVSSSAPLPLRPRPMPVASQVP